MKSILNRRTWPLEWREEYDQMIEEIIESTTNTHDRLSLFEGLLNDAVQAQRPWAIEVERACLRGGMSKEIKAYQDRNRVMVSYDGNVVSLPRVQGTKAHSESGQVYHQRELIDLWPFDQIDAKRRATLLLRQKYDEQIAHYDKLLALRDMCPGAATPQEAAETLGMDLDTFLRGAA